jgi:pyruvate dehydrogenase E2 component (dihydrolipoamide acetyltransferase)
MFTPVINPPQTAILGVCTILDRPRKAASGYGIELYPAMGLSLTYDHRAVDGAPASRFLQDVCKGLSEFESFLAGNQEA